MTTKNLKIIGLLFLILFYSSCNNNDDDNEEEETNECIEYKTTYVTSVNSPTNGSVNETINIEVNFGVSNGCGGFGKFIETENGNTKTIEVEAKYEGCICTQNAPIRMVNYEFTASNSGDYELNFKSSPTDFITINLMIN